MFLLCQVSGVQAKQVLQLGAQAPLDTIDISTSTGYGQTGNIYESLFRLDKNGKIEPGLAKSSSVSADGKTWTFKLRDAQFSNGDPIRAQDFVYSWQRTLKPATKSPYTNLFSNIQNAPAIAKGEMAPDQLGVRAVDDHTLAVSLSTPVAYMKTLMAYPLFAPQDQKVVAKYGNKYATNAKYMVYSGPFKLINWNGTREKWQFVKNDRYWDRQKVKLNQINYTVLENTSTALYLYQEKNWI
ncbi:bacterial extracellular solute-binding s, 5 Middle family protein [Latilactobacillus graminis DSM 20719]|uniref:Bacterial extracellular solute-binding s, 5 Middle family protein n=1 Tax=Latilactobacillus graminis DSM 20719 TaxID=1423752 RepID=A0AA89KY15_9LACO|nr:bacterial extracellular solute-binding s, 5 Middle family protein [Latilactobacillus graminis DSM 20719]